MELRFKNIAVVLIVLNIVAFVIQNIVDGFTSMFMLVSGDIIARPWILITSMFLHGSPSHLIFNMYALLLFGTLIEQKIGSKRFLFVYFLSGILAGIGFVLFQEFILGTGGAALGASGGMMGILGVTIMLLPNLRILFMFFIPMSMRTAGIIFAMMDLMGLFGIGMAGIANSAHLFGLATGIGFGYYLIRKKLEFHKRFVKPRKKETLHPGGAELSNNEIEDYINNGRL
ncbi:rhomboid family intramembrane serine protease [Candidatus Woesearchaeota archaeon]|nr:rhomboid family intramembrane serine protease [Candidatus Woesearchaeota archaeon]